MKQETQRFLSVAVRAAEEAGKLIAENIGNVAWGDVDRKQPADFVTRVDRESEKMIIETIRANFPDHGFLTEESRRDEAAERCRWIVDPLDGTTNFIHGYPVVSVSIALECLGEIVLGVIFDPTRRELFTAVKGEGSFLNGNPIRVSRIARLGDGLVATGFPFRRKEITGQYLTLFGNVFRRVSDLRRAGSAALDLAYVASGRCDGFFEIGLSPWDIAAGALIVEEAGGVVSDFQGGRDFLGTGDIVAGAPAIHKELVEEARRVFGEIVDT